MGSFVAGVTTTQAVGTSSAGAALPAGGGNQLRIASLAANAICFIRFGTGSIPTAVITDLPILPGTVEVFDIPVDATHYAVIGSASNTIYITRGNGW